MLYVYILRSLSDGTLYTGQTNDVRDRVRRHNRGQIQSTKAKAPYELAYFEIVGTRAEAMRREWQLKKKYNTERKRRLIEAFDAGEIEKIMGL